MGIGGISVWQLIIVILLIGTPVVLWRKSRVSPLNSVSTMWKSISYEEAKRHPLYGIKGWALFLWSSLVIFTPAGIVGSYVYFGSLMDQISSDAIRQLDDLNNFMLLGVFFNTMVFWFLGYKLWTKESNFQALFTWVLVGFSVVTLVVLLPYELTLYPTWMREGSFKEAYSGTFKGIAQMMVWIIYVWKSKRINVTCAHRVKANDAFFIELMNAQPRQQTDAKSEPTSRSSVVVEAKPDQSGVEAAQPVKTETKPAQDNPNKKSLPERSKEPIDDGADELYAIAWDEVEAKNTDKGLWARLYVKHDADEAKTKVAYLEERVKILIQQREVELQEKKRLEKERLEKEKKRLEEERLEKKRLEEERLEEVRLKNKRLEEERLEEERLEKKRLDDAIG